jgi:hypothetical protein
MVQLQPVGVWAFVPPQRSLCPKQRVRVARANPWTDLANLQKNGLEYSCSHVAAGVFCPGSEGDLLSTDGVLSAQNEALLAGVPPIPAGSKMEGQFFPVLFDPQSIEQ